MGLCEFTSSRFVCFHCLNIGFTFIQKSGVPLTTTTIIRLFNERDSKCGNTAATAIQETIYSETREKKSAVEEDEN